MRNNSSGFHFQLGNDAVSPSETASIDIKSEKIEESSEGNVKEENGSEQSVKEEPNEDVQMKEEEGKEEETVQVKARIWS